ncbi:MAG: hypothetical protein WDA60_19145 [Acidimicrobiia bacterium]
MDAVDAVDAADAADAAAEVVLDLELPDGRHLVVFADGREVVVGRAGARPHPVAGWEWLDRPPTRPRTNAALPTPRRLPRVTPAADRRARELLESLLTEEQRDDYRRTGRFWVPTPRGPVRLGELYRLVHRPVDRPHLEHVLCVVPRTYADLPLPDVWTNLLLTLAVEPDRFFDVAVFQGARRCQP